MLRALVAGHVCIDLIPGLTGPVDVAPGGLVEVGPIALRPGGCVANGLPAGLEPEDAPLAAAGVAALKVSERGRLPHYDDVRSPRRAWTRRTGLAGTGASGGSSSGTRVTRSAVRRGSKLAVPARVLCLAGGRAWLWGWTWKERSR
jgi:hypothetical protein